MSLATRLDELQIILPAATKPLASYVAVVRSGNLLFVSGQLPMSEGELMAIGKVPSQTPIDIAQQAARLCVINALAAIKAELAGDLSRVRRAIRVGVFVQSDHTFTEQHLVANGASNFLQELLGESGRHVRAAVGVNTLPLNAAVEVEFTFEIAE